ncbi:siroheme synthase CysG [Qipengyuania sp. MTN3-11]|uniref:siroheme synthase CysG n=1 Tax=Qipengyuania sp. MTN3-11 TaxID=3056557 RepID=UPI0036F3CEB0
MNREPLQTPPRIAPLAKLPLFHALHDRRVLVAGDTDGARWKAELLSAAGAQVLVLAGEAPQRERWEGLTASPVDGPVLLEARDWTTEDFDGLALAIADLEPAEGEAFAAAARAAHVPVNVVDKPALCDFQIGSIVNRSPVVIGISTDGAAPMLGQSIRSRIEAVLPPGLAGWAAAASRWRERLKRKVPDGKARRRFWERFTAAAWNAPEHAPVESDFSELLNDTGETGGSVTMVGAGPGDPELLTLKAVRALQTASVILYDDLVAPEVLELARREARRVSVGKRGRGPSVGQDVIDAELVRLARAGERVVRLKGGDPLVFGRATEELDACRAAGVPVTIVPGITATQGAAAALGFSLTERVHARRVQFVTGHGMSGTLPEDLDWRAIADPHATTAVYMPRATLAEFASRAIAAGLDPLTPALAVASATLPQQADVRCSLASLPQMAAKLPEGAPVLVVIGQVARENGAAALGDVA